MKVLISPIGQRDPWGTYDCQRPDPIQYGAALSIALDYRPDLVFLLPTLDRVEVGNQHTMKEAEATTAALSETLPGVQVRTRPYDLADPTDYDQVMPETERLLSEVLRELHGVADCEFVINVSSGTPQMQASLQLAVASGRIDAQVLQSRDPRFLRPGDRQVRPVSTRYWSEALCRDRARHFFDRGHFEACALEVEFLCATPHSGRRFAATQLQRLAQMYAQVHHINYSDAHRIAQSLLSAVRDLPEYSQAMAPLEAQAALLSRLPRIPAKASPKPGSHPETAEFLADVYHNAARCYRLHGYADCLARVWRALEGALYIRLRQQHRIDPTDVRASQNQELASRIIASLGRQADQDRIDITLGTAFRLFGDCIPDPEYLQLWRSSFPGTTRRVGQVADRLRDDRNNSVAGHDSLPVDAEKAQRGLQLAGVMLEALIPGIHLDSHPFAPTAISRVGKVFFDALAG